MATVTKTLTSAATNATVDGAPRAHANVATTKTAQHATRVRGFTERPIPRRSWGCVVGVTARIGDPISNTRLILSDLPGIAQPLVFAFASTVFPRLCDVPSKADSGRC